MSFNNKIKPAKSENDVYNYGIWLLAKREYSELKLIEKFKNKTDNQEWIESTIKKLKEQNYLNENRFVEMLIENYCKYKGYGPIRIKQELKQKGIDSNLVNDALDEIDFDFFESALQVLNNKFRNEINDKKENDKAVRFLVSRGFSFDMIKYALEDHLKE